jgi:dipeptidyl aminopeptidase/acylaminoacyl peptidase
MDPATAQAVGEPELIDGPMPALNRNSRFVWSPDMERLAFTGGDEQEVIHILRGQSVVSHRLAKMRVADLWWSADGSEILFYNTTSDRSDPYRTIHGLDPASGRIRELFPPTDRAHHIHVSSDRASMVFLRPLQIHPDSAERHAGELVVSELGDVDGGRVLVSTADIDGWLGTHYGQPRFSPDGSQVVYFRQQYTGPEYDDFDNSLWVQPVDGSSPAQKLVTGLRQDWVSWDPSGRWIVYQGYREGSQGRMQGMLSVVSVETGESHEILTWVEGITPGETLMDVQLAAWSPDGRWISITQSTGGLEYWVVDDPLGAGAGSPR